MKTDAIFYDIFQRLPGTFFRIVGQDPAEADHYRFTSEEVKQIAFRIDGVFQPTDAKPAMPLYFGEVQFWDSPGFYFDLFGKVFVFLKRHRPNRRWKAVALFAHRGLDPGIPLALQDVATAHLQVIYLDEWLRQHPDGSIGVRMVRLIMEPAETAAVEARDLLRESRAAADRDTAARTNVELIETILVYKFPGLTRKEVEAMFEITDVRQTRIYQEAMEEGKKEGKIEGKKEGKIEGEKKGKLSAVPALIKAGVSVEQAASELDLPIQAVEKAAARAMQQPRA